MSAPDWSKINVKEHQDSPWLRIPPTEEALHKFRPNVVFRPSEVRDVAAFAANVKKRVLFGHPKNTAPIRPKEWEYQYGTDDLSKAPAPVAKKLVPPSFKPDDPQPPPGFLHPKAGIFTLKQTTAYQRGYVYTVPYSLDAKTKEADLDRMMRVVAPPQLSPQVDETNKYVHLPVPECVKMIPGVPFALELDGDPHNLHTIGGCHTFESLRYEDDFWEIFEDTVLVAKGLRGCRPAGNTDEVFPITDYPIRTNDRSPADVPQGSKAGSYNLASTLLKGNGPGVVLPAAQVDEPKFAGQVSTILQSLAHLRQRLLRKTLSKYEYEATEFNSGDMNVVGFGGLEPHNATSCQLNLGPIWQLLHKALGLQGSPHPDSLDEETRKTYFLLLLNLPPGSDPGAFLLARTGLYIQELDTWAVHIFFDGTDIHTGIGATTTLSIPAFQHWVETELETAWKASEFGRMGIVQYAMSSAHNRHTYMSMTPSVRFGNFGPEQNVHPRDFATHGQEILGGQEPWANHMGREIIYNFWNQLQLCNLDLGLDINDVLTSITFQNSNGEHVPLRDLPFHPIHQAEHIVTMRGHFEYLRQRCSKLRIYIEKHHFLEFRRRLQSKGADPAKETQILRVQWESRSSIKPNPGSSLESVPIETDLQDPPSATTDLPGSVTKIIGLVRIAGNMGFRVLIEGDPIPQSVPLDDPRLPKEMVNEFQASELRKVSAPPILQDSSNGTLQPVKMPGVETPPDSNGTTPQDVEMLPIESTNGSDACLGPDSQGRNSSLLLQCTATIPQAEMQGLESVRDSTHSTGPNLPSRTSELGRDLPGLAAPNASDSSSAISAPVPPIQEKNNDFQTRDPSSVAGRTRSKCGQRAPEPMSSDKEVGEDIRYDVEKIHNVVQQSEGKFYLCKLAGYDEKEWVHEHNLSPECGDLLAEFYKSWTISADDDDSDDSPPKAKKKRLNNSDSPPEKSQPPVKKKQPLAKTGRIRTPSLGNTRPLETLLDVDRLALEVIEVKRNRPTQGPASKIFYRNLAAQAPLLNIVDTCYIQSRTISTLDMLIENPLRNQLEVTAAQFAKLAVSAQVIPELTSFERVTSLLRRILRWSNARAHIAVYRWCSRIGPASINALLELHRREGYPAFSAKPSIGRLVDHVVQYVCDSQKRQVAEAAKQKQEKQEKGGAKSKPKKPPKAGEKPREPNHSTFGPVPYDLSHVPGDLYGLLTPEGKRMLLPITLQNPRGLAFNVYAASERILLDIFQRVLILPAIRQCQDAYSIDHVQTTKNDDDTAFSRAIIRGAVMDCVLDMCKDDGILSSDAIDPVMQSPWLALGIAHQDRLGASLLNQVDITLAPLREWLLARLDQYPDIRESSSLLGDEIHTVMLEMAAGEPHPDTKDAAPSKAVPRKGSGSGQPRKARVVIYRRPDIDAILPEDGVPLLGLPALIIREALNLKRELPPADWRLRRLLQGQHATMSSAPSESRLIQRNPDHLDPCREFNRYTQLFKMHCPSTKLTGPVGLSNALAWFGTGQGAGTETFLNSLLPHGGFFQDDVSGMVQQFENAISQNAMNANRLNYEDTLAWGARPNNHLAVQPTKHVAAPTVERMIPTGAKRKLRGGVVQIQVREREYYTVLEKFDPMFAQEIQSVWEGHMGIAFNKNPNVLLRLPSLDSHPRSRQQPRHSRFQRRAYCYAACQHPGFLHGRADADCGRNGRMDLQKSRPWCDGGIETHGLPGCYSGADPGLIHLLPQLSAELSDSG